MKESRKMVSMNLEELTIIKVGLESIQDKHYSIFGELRIRKLLKKVKYYIAKLKRSKK